jgi:uncharacterized protein YkwD
MNLKYQKFTTVLVIFIFISFNIGIIFQLAAAFSVNAGALISLTNQARAKAGLSKLTQNDKLTQAATLKSQDMINKDYFAHTSPAGLNSWYWFREVNYSYRVAGENLAIDFTDSQSLFTAWMNSPTHKANIMDPNFSDIGIAAVSGEFQGHQSIAVTQMFGKPLEQNQAVKKIENNSQNNNSQTKSAPAEISQQNISQKESQDTNLNQNSQPESINAKVLFAKIWNDPISHNVLISTFIPGYGLVKNSMTLIEKIIG